MLVGFLLQIQVDGRTDGAMDGWKPFNNFYYPRRKVFLRHCLRGDVGFNPDLKKKINEEEGGRGRGGGQGGEEEEER